MLIKLSLSEEYGKKEVQKIELLCFLKTVEINVDIHIYMYIWIDRYTVYFNF